MKKNMMSFPIVIMKEGAWFVASCPVLDIATQAQSEQEVKKNMEELINEYLNDKDTPKPTEQIELASLSFIHAKIPKGDSDGKAETTAD